MIPDIDLAVRLACNIAVLSLDLALLYSVLMAAWPKEKW